MKSRKKEVENGKDKMKKGESKKTEKNKGKKIK